MNALQHAARQSRQARRFGRWLVAATLVAALAAAGPAQAAPVTVMQVGTFSTNPALPGNTDAQFSLGNKFVIKSTHDDSATPTAATINGLDFSAFNLQDLGNSLDLLVPMEGFGGTPAFVYTMDQSDNLGFFGPPRILFSATQTTNPGAPNNLPAAGGFVGYEFEGDFTNSDPAGPSLRNFVDMLVEVSSVDIGGGVISRTATFSTDAKRCIDDFCISPIQFAIRSNDRNPDQPTIAAAQAVVAEAGGDITYSAGALDQTTDASSQNNNLGNARTDKEDFVSYDWTIGGGALTGADADGTQDNIIPVVGNPTDVNPPGPHPQRAVENVNKTVAIENSGLAKTTDSAQWQVEANEALTGLGGSTDTLTVTYDNALPAIANASATAAGPGGFDLEFSLLNEDDDLAVNVLVANFEELFVDILVDGIIQSSFFSPLIGDGTGGTQLVSNADLISEFGLGSHTFKVNLLDNALDFGGATPIMASFDFDVLASNVPPVPEPGTMFLLGIGIAGLGFRRRRRTSRI